MVNSADGAVTIAAIRATADEAGRQARAWEIATKSKRQSFRKKKVSKDA
jgi:hypothetical protein